MYRMTFEDLTQAYDTIKKMGYWLIQKRVRNDRRDSMTIFKNHDGGYAVIPDPIYGSKREVVFVDQNQLKGSLI